MASSYSIRVLERSCQILNCFTRREPEKSLTEISREVSLNKSTTFRILGTLESMGWVTRNSKTGLYRLGLELFEIGSRAISGLNFYGISQPHLEQLVKVTGQTAHLGVRDGSEVLYVNKVEKPGAFISQPSAIGLRLPLYCTGMGKVLLAFSDDIDEALEKMYAANLKKFTRNTITKKSDLLEELGNVRALGYAVDDEEVQLGLRCVAAPIKDHSKKLVAAISVSGLTSVFNDRRLPFITNEVIKVSQSISRDLGCRCDECAIF